MRLSLEANAYALCMRVTLYAFAVDSLLFKVYGSTLTELWLMLTDEYWPLYTDPLFKVYYLRIGLLASVFPLAYWFFLRIGGPAAEMLGYNEEFCTPLEWSTGWEFLWFPCWLWPKVATCLLIEAPASIVLKTSLALWPSFPWYDLLKDWVGSVV